MIILGVDPGSVVCGYGVIKVEGNSLRLVEYGVVKAAKKTKDFYPRIQEIYAKIKSVIDRTEPEISAFETMFYSKNVQSLIKLSHARAAAILSALNSGLDIKEYSPREVKRAVTGNGNASKEQVQFMVKKILNIEETPEFFDSTDALAVAICHSMRNETGGKGATTWSEFVKKNPDRVKK